MVKREVFKKFVSLIKKSLDKDRERSEFLAQAFPDAFRANLLINGKEIEELIYLFSDLMDDEDEWICHFIFELEFGTRKDLEVKREDGSTVDISDADKLYDFLKEEKEK